MPYQTPTDPGDPMQRAAPATPGQALRAERAILRWAADRLMADDPVYRTGQNERAAIAGLLRRWADELDAAPGVYQLPAEPPASVHSLWDAHGCRWDRFPEALCWGRADERDDPHWQGWAWRRLLGRGPLSTTPPAGTEGERDG